MSKRRNRKKGASLVEAALVLPCLFLLAGAFLSFGLEQYVSVKEQAERHRTQHTEQIWEIPGKALSADLLIEGVKEVLPQSH